jgi:alpha-L-rhamnosidase
MYVCGLGYNECFVNGRRAGNNRLDPGQTDYRLRALYSVHDVTDSLEPGENALGVILGNGRYVDAYGFGKPRLRLQLLLEFEDGERRLVTSDASWKTSHGPIVHNGIYSGEVYDARLEQSGWDLPGFDDRAWHPAEIVDGPDLEAQVLPPIRAVASLPARSLSSPEAGVHIFDFGQNFSGVVRLKAEGPRGSSIRIRFSELLTASGNLNLGTNRESRSSDLFILKGEGLETFEPRFTYHGFRYAELTGFPGTPVPDTLEGLVIHTDVARSGAFLCGNGLVNKIHSNILWGQLANLMSAPTDCPQRGERMGWLGDAQLASEEACNNFDMAGFYAKYLEDIRLAQRADGSLSDVVPPYWPLYPTDPAWGSAYVTLARAMYDMYGDAEILERHYGGMKRYVDYLDAESPGHINESLGRYGDWCPPGCVYPKKTPVELTSTWYLYNDTLVFSGIAALLGRDADAASYAARASDIADAFNEEFLLGDGRYATVPMSKIDRTVGQTSQALPLYHDMVPAEQKDRAFARLVDSVVKNADGHIDAGIVGARYIFEVLREGGRADLAWAMITQTSYPGWGYMVAEGATTLWERWEKLGGMGMNSHNHIMFGSVDAWFYRSLAGIVPLAPGWRRLRIKPFAFGDLDHAQAKLDTIRGPVSASWKRGSRDFAIEVGIPLGARAEMELPIPSAGGKLLLSESGSPLWLSAESGTSPAAAIRPAWLLSEPEIRGDRLCFAIASGTYSFSLS